MQQLINALLIIVLNWANQTKPIHYAIRRASDTFIEFHSGYVIYIEEGYATITNADRSMNVRTRLAVDGKMSIEFMNVLKDLLNKDFNSWIKIEDEANKGEEREGKENNGNVDEWTTIDSDKWICENNDEWQGNEEENKTRSKETKKSTEKHMPSRAEADKKKKK